MRRTVRTRAAALGVLAVLVLSGCGKDESDTSDADSSETPSATATSDDSGSGDATTEPSPGQVGSEECTLERDDVDLVVRDWTRVQDTVGRGDHGRFTSGLVRRLDGLADRAADCDGAKEFSAFATDVSGLDERSGDAPDYAAYTAAQDAGNAWLDAAGLGDNALLRG